MSDSAPTSREQAKAVRREALLDAAASLFAQRGFAGVSIEELGAAAGVSGPAVYRHFTGKQAILADLLIGVSEYLLDGATAVIAQHASPAASLSALVDFQIDFALANASVIRVQDRELASMAAPDAARVRSLQRSYVALWVQVLTALHPGAEKAELSVMAHAAFGLINSTPYSLRGQSATATGRVLRNMALRALHPES